MGFSIAGLASGLSRGLMTGMHFRRALKDEQRDEEKFGWEKQDREKKQRIAGDNDAAWKDIQSILFEDRNTAPATPAGAGLTPRPPMTAAGGSAPDAVTSALATGTTPEPQAAPPLAAAANTSAVAPYAASGLTPAAPKPALRDNVDLAGDISRLNRAFFTLAKNGSPLDPTAVARYSMTAEILQNEGIMQAAKMLKMGNSEGALQALNSTGRYRGIKEIGVQDAEYDSYGTKAPTKIGTYLLPDGRTFTLNADGVLHSAMEQGAVFKLMQKGAEMKETQRHNRATEAAGTTRANAAMKAAETKATKAGAAKPVRYPQRNAVLDAQDLIKGDPELSKLGEDDQKKLAFNVAARSQALIAQQPGIDAAEALNQALGEETANITPGEQRSFLGFDRLAPDKKPTYTDRRTAPRVPAAAPATATTQPTQPAAAQPVRITGVDDYNRLPSGAVYIDPNGVTKRKR